MAVETSLPHPLERKVEKRGADALPLKLRIDGDDVNLAHAIFVMDAKPEKAGKPVAHQSHPNLDRLVFADRLDIGSLPRFPTARIEVLVDVCRYLALHLG